MRMSQGSFDGSMPRNVLEYYLAHAASAQWISRSDTLDDDIRVILKTGLKFLGRAAGIWKGDGEEEGHFANAKALIPSHVDNALELMDVHALDSVLLMFSQAVAALFLISVHLSDTVLLIVSHVVNALELMDDHFSLR